MESSAQDFYGFNTLFRCAAKPPGQIVGRRSVIDVPFMGYFFHCRLFDMTHPF